MPPVETKVKAEKPNDRWTYIILFQYISSERKRN